MKLAVIIPAAGSSSRYAASGGLRSKIDEDLGGRAVLQRTVELFNTVEAASLLIVAGPAGEYDQFIARHGDKLGLLGVRVCKGGEQHRWQTVRNALALVPEDGGFTHVAAHDAARPCTPADLIERVLNAAMKHPAVIPAIEVPDTLKRVAASARQDKEVDPLEAILGGAGLQRTALRTAEATVSRENLVQVQTPQVFEIGLLRRAYAQPDLTSTDDAGLIERLGEPVVVVEGDPRNIKITRTIDLHLARLILQLKAPEGRPLHKRF